MASGSAAAQSMLAVIQVDAVPCLEDLGDAVEVVRVVTRSDVSWADLDADIVLTTIEPPVPDESVVVIQPFFTEGDADRVRHVVSRVRRVHRRALLNLAHVTRLEPLETGGYIARTTKGHSVEISRQSARELRRMLGLRRGTEGVGAHAGHQGFGGEVGGVVHGGSSTVPR